MDDEIWRDIKEYEGLYKVSSKGRVLGCAREVVRKGLSPLRVKERFLGLHPNKKRRNYLYISLHKEGKEKRRQVHRLVAEAFIPNPDNLPQVNHMDGDKNNNTISNLEWVSCKQNAEHSWRTGLSSAKHKMKPVYCPETGREYESVIAASLALHIDRGGISDILTGKKRKVKGFSFICIGGNT